MGTWSPYPARKKDLKRAKSKSMNMTMRAGARVHFISFCALKAKNYVDLRERKIFRSVFPFMGPDGKFPQILWLAGRKMYNNARE